MFQPLIRARRLVVCGAVLVSVLVLAPTIGALPAREHAVPPPNDAFAAAQVLAGTSGDTAASSQEATKETGEPAHSGNAGGASVWFRWTPDRTGRMTLLTRQITFDTVLAVYTGASVDSLTPIASNDNFGNSLASRVTFPVVPGTDYFIAVDGVNGVSGPFALRWRQGPQNDDFADASLLDATGSVAGTLYGATSEPGEPLHNAGATAWYRWVAPEDGKFAFRLDGAPVATVYSGASVSALTTLGSGTEIVFLAVGGTQYSIAVESGWNDSNGFQLNWGGAPTNDDFADSQVINGRSGTVAGTDAFATLEADERSDFGSNTVWYTWTAPRTEHVRFEIRSETLTHDTVLSVWEGASLDALSLLEENDDFFGLASALSFEATEGTTYNVRLSGYWSGAMGGFDLDWYPGAIIFGSSRGNVINGTPGRDYINAFGGRDVIRGRGGDDFIDGGSGGDRVYGGVGNDSLRGGPGPDLLFGGAGNDQLIARDGMRGNDVIFGGSGTDTVQRDRGDEVHQVP
jgi:Ca2+-binding RTX toxin-like protein